MLLAKCGSLLTRFNTLPPQVPDANEDSRFAYYFCILLVFNTMLTVVNVRRAREGDGLLVLRPAGVALHLFSSFHPRLCYRWLGCWGSLFHRCRTKP